MATEHEKIVLEADKIYALPIKNGHLDIRVMTDPCYPGLDIEYFSNKEDDISQEEFGTRPRVLIENNEGLLRALVWGDPQSEDYTEDIDFTCIEDLESPIILKATDIQWDIDIDEGYDKLDDMTVENASKALQIPQHIYANMTTQERHDYAYDRWHHHHASLCEFVGAPDEVVIPDPTDPYWNEETISNYISNEKGWCHSGFKIVCNLSKEELLKIAGAEHLAEIIN